MSKLNPQKASAYVGPGVLRKGGKITPVPNGPLIKKKGIYAGSTLKAGGKIKKAQNGEYVTQEDKNYTATKKVKTKNGPRYYQGKSPNLSFAMEIASFKERANPSDSIPKARLSPRALEMMDKKKAGGVIKKAQTGKKVVKGNRPGMGVFRTTKERTTSGGVSEPYKYKTESIDTTGYSKGRKNYEVKTVEGEGDKTRSKVTSSKSKTISKKDVPATLKSLNKAKAGAMIKRADGSFSKPGLWDNIRANKGSGKKPTKQMLQQEKKIKAKSK